MLNLSANQCDPFEEDHVSNQCDILVYDQANYPIVYADGPLKVVWPQSVRMVIEVKTNFEKKDVRTALDNIAIAQQLNDWMYGVVFAFTSPNLKTVLKNVKEYSATLTEEQKPIAILLLDKGIIIYKWKWTRWRDNEDNANSDPPGFGVRVAKMNPGSIVVAFLLLLFVEKVGEGRGVYSSDAINVSMNMLKMLTDRLADI